MHYSSSRRETVAALSYFVARSCIGRLAANCDALANHIILSHSLAWIFSGAFVKYNDEALLRVSSSDNGDFRKRDVRGIAKKIRKVIEPSLIRLEQ